MQVASYRLKLGYWTGEGREYQRFLRWYWQVFLTCIEKIFGSSRIPIASVVWIIETSVYLSVQWNLHPMSHSLRVLLDSCTWSGVHELAATISLGILSGNTEIHPSLIKWNLYFTRWFICTLKFEKHHRYAW